jgi:hypothetical protein
MCILERAVIKVNRLSHAEGRRLVCVCVCSWGEFMLYKLLTQLSPQINNFRIFVKPNLSSKSGLQKKESQFACVPEFN